MARKKPSSAAAHSAKRQKPTATSDALPESVVKPLEVSAATNKGDSQMSNIPLEKQLETLKSGLRDIGEMLLQLANRSESTAPSGLASFQAVGAAATAAGDLDLNERLIVVKAAIAMLDQVYVHLPLKKSMHAIDPVQRLRLLEKRVLQQINLQATVPSVRAFHDEMIEIFHSLRDLHTNYVLPGIYQGRVAYLPFLVEEYFIGSEHERKYVVSKLMTPFPGSESFKVGVTVTQWNGMPIDRAIELNAAREAGSNEDARHARGLEALTLRPMSLSAPPDEAWVVVGYTASTPQDPKEQQFELKLSWQMELPGGSPNAVDTGGSLQLPGDVPQVFGFDAVTVALNRAKKHLFYSERMQVEEQMANLIFDANPLLAQAPMASPDFRQAGYDVKAEAIRPLKRAIAFSDVTSASAALTNAVESAKRSAAAAPELSVSDTTSLLPEFFAFRKVVTPSGELCYIRIWTFMTYYPSAFVAEFVRIANLFPTLDLIIDVRGNGGGNINAGELLLQVLTTRKVEPERFHFRNTDSILELCQPSVSGLNSWVESISESLAGTGEVYSQGFPLTDISQSGNAIANADQRKKALIIDALCYSTTDIFAAGFQDNQLGKIIGTNDRTGAGGANVWEYEDFNHLSCFQSCSTLPKQVSFRTAMRRSTRIGEKNGVPLEDLGVRPTERYFMTLDDVLKGNEGLINFTAAALLQAK